MAGMTSVIAGVSAIAQGASLVSSLVDRGTSQRQSVDQLRAQQQLSQQQATQDSALERERIALETQQAEETRKRALRRSVARQRAQFGGSGISAGSGSSEAVLLGLLNESDEERSQREQLDNLRNKSINQDLSQQARLNILQRTQLQERQNLSNATSFFGLLN